MTPDQLSDALLRCVRGAVGAGELGAAVVMPGRVRLRPRRGREREWGTGLALELAGPAGLPARRVASLLRERLAGAPGIAAVAVEGAGFLTISLDEGADAALLAEVLARPVPRPLPEDPARDAACWAAVAGGDPAGGLLVQRESNPLFRVRYAHARCRALLRGGRALGLVAEPGAAPFTGAAERTLLAAIGERPVRERTPRRLLLTADALLETERARSALPVGDEKPGAVHRARLALVQAAGAVLADGLFALGVSAPDHL